MQGTPLDVVTDTSRMERVQQSGSIARLGWPQDTSTDWEGDIPKDQDKVRDCRERCSSWTGLDDLRGRQLPSPFLLPLYSPWSHRSMAMRTHPALDQHLRLIRITSPPNERLQAQPHNKAIHTKSDGLGSSEGDGDGDGDGE
jgi:hypothetical protein